MSMNPRLLRPLATIDPDAAAWRSAVTAAGSSVSGGVVDAVSRFIKGCKSDGIWDAMKNVVLLAGADTLTGALVPLKGTAPTSYNFASGDYSKTSGLKGNGSSTYLDSNRANNADPQNNNHNSVYVTQAQSTGIGGYLGSGDDTAVANRIIVNRTSGALLTKSRSASGGSVAGTSNATGFIGTQRSGSAGFSTIANGTLTATTEASGSPGSAHIVVFNRSLNFLNITDGRLAFYSIGESLDLALLDARVSALMTAIGVS